MVPGVHCERQCRGLRTEPGLSLGTQQVPKEDRRRIRMERTIRTFPVVQRDHVCGSSRLTLAYTVLSEYPHVPYIFLCS